MKRLIFFITLLWGATSLFAQDDNLIYKFKGVSFEPSKDMFITLALQSNSSLKFEITAKRLCAASRRVL